MIHKNESWTLTCTCGKNITITNIKQAKEQNWLINQGCYSIIPYKEQDRGSTLASREIKAITEALCPECAEKERLKKYKSTNIRDRLAAGYYKDYPDKWEDDVLRHIGLVGHPKASELLSMAYDRGHSGGNEEMLGEAEYLAPLLK
jgi:hypothetical protein